MPNTIAFVNGKGGVGKTTVATLFAALLKESGASVSIDDRDPQKGATSDAPAFGLECGTHGYYVIIDTAPNLENKATLDAIINADIVVIVTTPSLKDRETTINTALKIKELRQQDRVFVLYNRVSTGSKSAAEIPLFKKLLPFPSLDKYLPKRLAYENIGANGWQALDKEILKETKNLVAELAAKVIAQEEVVA